MSHLLQDGTILIALFHAYILSYLSRSGHPPGCIWTLESNQSVRVCYLSVIIVAWPVQWVWQPHWGLLSCEHFLAITASLCVDKVYKCILCTITLDLRNMGAGFIVLWHHSLFSNCSVFCFCQIKFVVVVVVVVVVIQASSGHCVVIAAWFSSWVSLQHHGFVVNIRQ